MVSGGHTYDVAVGPNTTALKRDGKLCFGANAGVVVRHYILAHLLFAKAELTRLTFSIKSVSGVRVTTAEFEAGSATLKIDSQGSGPLEIRDGRAAFDLPAGQHLIEIDK